MILDRNDLFTLPADNFAFGIASSSLYAVKAGVLPQFLVEHFRISPLTVSITRFNSFTLTDGSRALRLFEFLIGTCMWIKDPSLPPSLLSVPLLSQVPYTLHEVLHAVSETADFNKYQHTKSFNHCFSSSPRYYYWAVYHREAYYCYHWADCHRDTEWCGWCRCHYRVLRWCHRHRSAECQHYWEDGGGAYCRHRSRRGRISIRNSDCDNSRSCEIWKMEE